MAPMGRGLSPMVPRPTALSLTNGGIGIPRSDSHSPRLSFAPRRRHVAEVDGHAPMWKAVATIPMAAAHAIEIKSLHECNGSEKCIERCQ
jgi:hypothetical protein